MPYCSSPKLTGLQAALLFHDGCFFPYVQILILPGNPSTQTCFPLCTDLCHLVCNVIIPIILYLVHRLLRGGSCLQTTHVHFLKGKSDIIPQLPEQVCVHSQESQKTTSGQSQTCLILQRPGGTLLRLSLEYALLPSPPSLQMSPQLTTPEKAKCLNSMFASKYFVPNHSLPTPTQPSHTQMLPDTIFSA